MTKVVEGSAEVQQQIGIIRPQPHRLALAHQRCIDPSQRLERQPLIAQRLDEPWLEFEGALMGAQGRLGTSKFTQQQAAVIVSPGIVRGERDCPVTALQGRIQGPLLT
ncbi:hypothetical protein AY586_16655 [Marichromatium gracile]|uniref:Uncharacterized protein n=1 Tax=Marichromatium gracile TaxID=1048 RepID=A0ABR5VD26_MARGR|nr:hypothetical protein AY586_16655 [Marichromatium gracile]